MGLLRLNQLDSQINCAIDACYGLDPNPPLASIHRLRRPTYTIVHYDSRMSSAVAKKSSKRPTKLILNSKTPATFSAYFPDPHFPYFQNVKERDKENPQAASCHLQVERALTRAK